MNAFNAIKERQSMKHYDINHKLTDDEINQLMSLAVLYPTSFNMQNWIFVILKDPQIRKQIHAAISSDQAQVTDASLLLIVVCAYLKSWNDNPGRHRANSAKEAQDFLISTRGDYLRRKRPVAGGDETMKSCRIATPIIMLASKSKEYDSNLMMGFDPEKITQTIKLAQEHTISMLIAVVKQTQPAMPGGRELSLDKAIFVDKFSENMEN